MKISISRISELTGHDPKTIRQRLIGVPSSPGPKNSKTYESKDILVLRNLVGSGDGEDMSLQEAQRLLTIARTNEIDLNMQVTRKERIPLTVIEEINEEALSNVAGMLKANTGKTLDMDLVNDVFGQFRSIGAKLRNLVK